MSAPKRHHFLPQQAYLRFFSVCGRGEQIVVYRREKQSFVTSLKNVGVEAELYSLIDETGDYDRRLETELLSSLDTPTIHLVDRLNRESPNIALTECEFETLHDMLAGVQLIRNRRAEFSM